MIKACLKCNQEFTVKTSFQKYCSAECRQNDYKKTYRSNNPLELRACLVCGTVFIPTRAGKVYCSRACMKRHCNQVRGNKRYSGNRQLALERDDYKCVICGSKTALLIHHKDETGQTNDPNNELTNLITICRTCHAQIHKPTRWREPRHKIVYCQTCGKEMTVGNARYADNRGKYCSRECADKSKVTKVVITCQHCGNPFEVQPARLKRGKVKYCSMECRKAAGYATRKPK